MGKSPQKYHNIIAFILFVAATLAFIVVSSRVVMPKRYDLGANWGAFQAEQRDSFELIFFGNSLSYCNAIPALIWEDSGLASYILGGAEQTTAVTYYYVKEMFRRQSPQAIMVEASNVIYDAQSGYDAIKVNIGYMPYHLPRLEAIWRVAPEEQRLGLIFPLYNYHDRWRDLTADDWRCGLLGYPADPLAGYTLLSEVEAQQAPRERSIEQNEEEYLYNIGWLQEIARLAARHDCRCIFYLSASYAYFPEDYLQRLQADLSACGAELWNCPAELAALGLDPAQDFSDILHFNFRGAEKNSHYLSSRLQAAGVTPRQPYRDCAAWQERLDYYAELRQAAENSSPL